MPGFFFTYECKIDDKGRLLLPNKLKSELASYIPAGFILKRSVYFGCLEFWPRSEWDKESTVITSLNRFKRENVELKRKYLAGLKTVDPDGSGRLLIPKDLLAFAGIEKDIVMNGIGDIIEIWDKIRYEAEITKGESVEVLVDRILGGQSQNPEQ